MLNCGKESWEKSSTTAGTLTGESIVTEEFTKVSDDEGRETPNWNSEEFVTVSAAEDDKEFSFPSTAAAADGAGVTFIIVQSS